MFQYAAWTSIFFGMNPESDQFHKSMTPEEPFLTVSTLD
jgi:hypothetical protein